MDIRLINPLRQHGFVNWTLVSDDVRVISWADSSPEAPGAEPEAVASYGLVRVDKKFPEDAAESEIAADLAATLAAAYGCGAEELAGETVEVDDAGGLHYQLTL